MYIQIDTKTYIRKDQISMVTFGISSTTVCVVGSPNPVRVVSRDAIEELRALVAVKETPEVPQAPEPQEAPAPEVPEKKSRSKKA